MPISVIIKILDVGIVFFSELAESLYYLYQATGDPVFINMGEHMVNSINNIARVHCGFATVRGQGRGREGEREGGREGRGKREGGREGEVEMGKRKREKK